MPRRLPAIDTLAVIVPARNEQALIDGCLHAVQAAVRYMHQVRPTITVETLVVLDSCSDQTAARVMGHRDVGAISCDAKCVGASRGLAIDHVLQHVAEPSRLWIANTDADSRVPLDWLAAMMHHADDGADVVLGTVLP